MEHLDVNQVGGVDGVLNGEPVPQVPVGGVPKQSLDHGGGVDDNHRLSG